MQYKYLKKITTHSQLRELNMESLVEFAAEIRHRITNAVSAHGGHLASNLGVVELTIALHYVYDFYEDSLVFDVGHQCYVHKMITGRVDAFDKLRQQNGLSGFPSPKESGADPFYVGHAGTAIATSVGLALGAQMQQSNEHIVAFVGDASIVNGVAFEGLNNISKVKRQMLLVFNDNSMGISKTEGGFARYLEGLRVSHSYEEFHKRTKKMLLGLPIIGGKIKDTLGRIKDGIKSSIQGTHQGFDHLGIPYFGPIDGHDLPSLIKLLTVFKDVDHPLLLHVNTKKGHGFEPAIKDPCTFHSPAAFDLTGETATMRDSKGKSFTKAFSQIMSEYMAQDEKIVVLTAAMPGGTGVDKLQEQFPHRTLDVGIAESAGIDIAAGLAKSGMKPVVAIYSTFMQRGFDQIFQEVTLQDLPVIFCMDRAGMVGGDGAVHQGFCDIAFMRCLPNMIVAAPADESDLKSVLKFALQSSHPVAIRYPRDNVCDQRLVDPKIEQTPFQLGKAQWMKHGKDIVVVAYGVMVEQALIAADNLSRQAIDVGVVNARFAKPLDAQLIDTLLSDRLSTPVITVEDHSLAGGFGAAVLEHAQAHQLNMKNLHALGLPDKYIEQNSRAGQLAEVGIDALGIENKIKAILKIVTTDTPRDKNKTAQYNRT